MKHLLYIAVLLCLVSCEDNIDETVLDIDTPDSTEISPLNIEFYVQSMYHGITVPNTTTIKIFENKEEVFSDILSSGNTYNLNWNLNPEVKTYIEFFYDQCISIIYDGYEHLAEAQEIVELTPDKNNKRIIVYMTNGYNTKNINATDLIKVTGQIKNSFGDPVVAPIEWYNLDLTETVSAFDGTHTDENGFFELFGEPDKIGTLYIAGCINQIELNTFQEDIDLGPIEVCPSEHFAALVSATIKNCDGSASNGFMKTYKADARQNQFIKYTDGILNMPIYNFGQGKIDVQFFDSNMEAKSEKESITLSQNSIDLGTIELCKNDKRKFNLEIDGVSTEHSDIFFEKNLYEPNKFRLESKDFLLKLEINNQMELNLLSVSYFSSCRDHDWLANVKEEDFEIINFLDNQDFPFRVKGSSVYFDEVLQKNVTANFEIEAPLNIVN